MLMALLVAVLSVMAVGGKNNSLWLEAQEEAGRLNGFRSGNTKGSRVKPYDCPWCEGWHVGHDNKFRRDMQRYIAYKNKRR